MAIRTQALASLSLLSIFAGGCIGPLAREEPAPAGPAPLIAAPTSPVAKSALPPPAGAPVAAPLAAPMPTTGVPAPGVPVVGAPATVAGVSPTVPAPAATGNVDIGRTDLLGGWTLASGGDSCQLFMSLTTWSGGYRATTRGCSTPPLQGVSAWNLEGRQVMLLNDSGGTVARLYPSSKTQFAGLSQGGGPVTVSR